MSASDVEVHDVRTVGMHGSEVKRRLTESLRLEGELHSTQQDRFFCRDVLIGPNVDHGDIGSEAAMLSLDTASALSQYNVPVGCWPKDTCRRTDTVPPSFWTCKSNHGETADDWERTSSDDTGTSLTGHWEPLTNGNSASPEVLFNGTGDILMTWVED